MPTRRSNSKTCARSRRARMTNSFAGKKKRERKKTRAADETNAAKGGQKGGQNYEIRATIHAGINEHLIWNGEKAVYYAAGGGDGNFLEVRVERKSAGGDFVRVEKIHVTVGLVIVKGAKSRIDPAKANVMTVFRAKRNGKLKESGNPVQVVHGHPDRFHLKGGTSASHWPEKKCFFAVKVSASAEGPDGSTIRTISTIANFSLSDGRTEDRIWLMSKIPKKKKADATKSAAPPSSSNKRKRDEIENTPRQAKKERVKTEMKAEMAAVKTEYETAAVKTEYETAAVKKDRKYGIEVVTLPLASFVKLEKQVAAQNQEYERMRSELEKLRRVVSDKRKACCKCCKCAGCTGFTFPFDVIAPRSKSTEVTYAEFSAMHEKTTDTDDGVEPASLQYAQSTESIGRLKLDRCWSTSSLRCSDSVETYDDHTIKTE